MKFQGLVLSSMAMAQRNLQLKQAQKVVDRKVLQYIDPYVPIRTGKLKASSSATRIGSGVVKYSAPYARARYYHGGKQSRLRGKFWFSRMKADNKKKILQDAGEELR